MRVISKAVVLGAGAMGAQIAAHMASSGISVDLLDIVPPDLKAGESRDKLARGAIDRLRKVKPAALMRSADIDLITPGNFEDHLARVAEADWVLEAVVERLEVKQALWARVGALVRLGTILTSNTSGLSCKAQAEALPAEHRPNFLGTHFFNPVRYLKLLELVPTSYTDPALMELMAKFMQRALGKGTVVCNDSPNFIANRIGLYGCGVTLQVMAEMGLNVDEVDAITGQAMARPKSATFRTMDIAGLATFQHVARNTVANTNDPEEKALLNLPRYVAEMVNRGWIGVQAGQGFYREVRTADGRKERQTLNLQTLEYGPSAKVEFPILEQVKGIRNPFERIRTLVQSPDPAGRFAWKLLSRTLAFCAAKLQEMASGDVNAVDRAMRWGYLWDFGPFEIWNGIGVRESVARMEADGLRVPAWVKEIDRFPVDHGGEQPLSFTVIKADPTRVVKSLPGATLMDLGDEVLGLEFHSPKQALGADYNTLARFGAAEACRNWRGLVISASALNFCVGANVGIVLEAARTGQWAELEQAVRDYQNLHVLLKYLPRPVVVAPHGMTLGGGAEAAMHSARTVAAAETYMGLVEVGVGLIPGAAGCKELAVRAARMLPAVGSQMPNRPELMSFLAPAFEVIATAKVSGSAAEARDLGFLRPTDQVVMNRDNLLQQAKQAVLELDRAGYTAPHQTRVPVAGPDGRAILELAAASLRDSGYATAHDFYIAQKLAYVLTGGPLPAGTLVTEEYLLDVEREAFLHLCGHPLSQARMAQLLQTGKPLRN